MAQLRGDLAGFLAIHRLGLLACTWELLGLPALRCTGMDAVVSLGAASLRLRQVWSVHGLACMLASWQHEGCLLQDCWQKWSVRRVRLHTC